uniref:Uncharacterized protein LOC111103078 n=1 Tax=Crassostrea virginica TaxID=6565 RepID=A0A8B8AME2_CRAVI|nr:uncharacterized protein LOC111103078 [Crassostrea virginica]XP_022291793.1 uncharacterized protein LOC111103078 [Crassostrea virginica]XP_022291794.1 uncharacterized protein LOC111103078 [Crassostrea virginica]
MAEDSQRIHWERRHIQKNYKMLKEKMEHSEYIFDHLFQNKILDTEENSELLGQSRKKQCDFILRKLIKRPDTFQTFVNFLNENKTIDEFQCFRSLSKVTPDVTRIPQNEVQELRQHLQCKEYKERLHSMVRKHLSKAYPNNILDDFLQEDLINVEEHEDISSLESDTDKAFKLLESYFDNNAREIPIPRLERLLYIMKIHDIKIISNHQQEENTDGTAKNGKHQTLGCQYCNTKSTKDSSPFNNFEEKRQNAVRLFQEKVEIGGKTLNIALIGPPGCGKSSFCNSVLTAFSVEGWREWTTTGHYGGLAEQVTHHLRVYQKNEYLDVKSPLYAYNYPTLFDMIGFNESIDDMVEKILRMVFFGRLPREQKIMDVVNYFRSNGVDVIGLKEHNAKNPEDLKIDRIIFIASANTPLPKRLIEAVKKTALKENRVIPIYGVLTHKDKINPKNKDYQSLEKDFRQDLLGLPENRFLLCTNYCDDYDTLKEKKRMDQRHPELDIPILEFMRQVCDPKVKVINDQTKYGVNMGESGTDSTTPATTTDQVKERPEPAELGTPDEAVPARVEPNYFTGVVIALVGIIWIVFLRLLGLL